VEISVRARADQAVVEVSDTGIGIEPGELRRIWERLYRGDKSRSERGPGLGLSLVKAIVEAHQGTVSVSSTPGRGTQFQMRLPLSHA
jgi:signal transduction histidine kinase